MKSAKIQINRNEQENICIAYIKELTSAKFQNQTLGAYCMLWLPIGHYYNNVQYMEMIDLCRRLVGAFGTERAYDLFREINL